MASLLDIKARIKAVENIKKITRAMQLVAAAKFARAQGRARSARPYSDELDLILSALAAAGDSQGDSDMLELSFGADEPPMQIDRAQLFQQVDSKRPGLILISADRGLCGSFNTRLMRAAHQFIKKNADKDVQLITLGRKGHTYFQHRKEVPIIHAEENISDKLDLDGIKRITDKLVRLYVSGTVDSLFIIYAQFESAMVSHIKVDQFLSIPPVEGEGEESTYILEPDREAVYETLIPLYATTKIFAALADSFASEYGARMAAMQMATKNAEEMLEAQVLLRNRLRQAIITRELAELVGGAEAQS